MVREIKQFIGKYVYIVLKSGRQYSGKINAVEEDQLFIIDKFKKIVFINISEISSMEEEREGGK